MSAPAAWQMLVRLRTESVVYHPVGVAGLAHDPDICGAARLADLLQLQNRPFGTAATAVDVLLPGKVVEVARRTGDEKPGRYGAGAPVVASVVIVASLVGAVHGNIETEQSLVDWSEQVAPRTAKPPRERMHRNADAGPLLEGIRGLLLPWRCAEFHYSVTSLDSAYRADESRLDDTLGVLQLPSVDASEDYR